MAGRQSRPEHSPGGVVVLTAEDDPATTIRPRMEAAGADVGLVTVVSTVTSADGSVRLPVFPDDTDFVVSECERLGARLLVIDPVTAYLGDVNSYRDSDVRGALAPLAAAVEEAGVAVVLIRHLNKGVGGSALYRGGGSIAFAGLARIVWVAGHDPNNPSLRAVAVSKNNISAFPPTLGYDLVSAGPLGVGKANWLGPAPLTADDLVSPPAPAPRGSALEEAASFLQSALAGGPQPSAIVAADAREAGIALKTLRRAKDELGVQSRRKGGVAGNGSWDWSLPDEDAEVDFTSMPALFRDDAD
jgi:putative DNA primase/helicase